MRILKAMSNIRSICILTLSVCFVEEISASLYAPVQDYETNKWGYIDYKGLTIVPFKYELAFNFSFDKALVLKDKWYYLDKKDLKEHLLDTFMQGYLKAMTDSLLDFVHLEKNWISIMNFLNPSVNEHYWRDYDFFHLCAENTLVINKSFCKPAIVSYNNYLLYNLNSGILRNSINIVLATPIVNRSFIGFQKKKGVRFNNNYEALGIYNAEGTKILNLEPVRQRMLKKLKKNLSRYYARKKVRYVYTYTYTSISDNCSKVYIHIQPNYPDPETSIDTQFLFSFDSEKPIEVSKHPPVKEKDRIIGICKCRNSEYNYREYTGKVAYFKYNETDSVFINPNYFQLTDKTLLYIRYQIDRYYKNPQSLELYPFFLSETLPSGAKTFKSGVWDGEKIIIKPTYRLIGIFN